MKKKGLHEHTNEPGAGFINKGQICSLPTHLEFLRKCSGVGLSQVRLQVLQGIVTLRQAFWQGLFWDMGLQWALYGGGHRGTRRIRQRAGRGGHGSERLSKRRVFAAFLGTGKLSKVSQKTVE